MLDRFGVTERDRRKLYIVVGIMAVVMAVIVDGPLLVRIVVGGIMGLVSGIGFLVMTNALERFDLEY